MIFHVIKCIKTCQREHVNKISRTIFRVFGQLYFEILRGVGKLKKSHGLLSAPSHQPHILLFKKLLFPPPVSFLINPSQFTFNEPTRVISDRVHRLLVTLSYFWPDIFVQLLSLIPILLLYLLVSINLAYTGLYQSVSLEKATIF